MSVIKWTTKEEIDNPVPPVIPLTEDQKKIESLVKDNADLREMLNFIIVNY